MLSLTMQFPCSSTASQCMSHPRRGTSNMSPGERSRDGISMYSAKDQIREVIKGQITSVAGSACNELKYYCHNAH